MGYAEAEETVACNSNDCWIVFVSFQMRYLCKCVTVKTQNII